MNTQEFKLRGECVALCDLLKLAGIADSGGRAC
jgi:ribosome-associated protein YbcJ (S4-like RNA binding protein)